MKIRDDSATASGSASSHVASAATIFAVAVALNYPWEIAQSPLFEQTDGVSQIWWHCFLAALGDGVLVLLIHAAGALALGTAEWYRRPGLIGYVVMAVVGLAIAVIVEWVAVHRLNRWAYGPAMPLVPGLAIGLVPIAQMLVLPPIVLRLAAALAARRRVTRRQARTTSDNRIDS